jgi:hypothetical protein
MNRTPLIAEIAAGLSPHAALTLIELSRNLPRNILRTLPWLRLDNNLCLGFKLEYRPRACRFLCWDDMMLPADSLDEAARPLQA